MRIENFQASIEKSKNIEISGIIEIAERHSNLLLISQKIKNNIISIYKLKMSQ